MHAESGMDNLIVRCLISAHNEILVMERDLAFSFELSEIIDWRRSISKISFRRNPAKVMFTIASQSDGTGSTDKEQ